MNYLSLISILVIILQISLLSQHKAGLNSKTYDSTKSEFFNKYIKVEEDNFLKTTSYELREKLILKYNPKIQFHLIKTVDNKSRSELKFLYTYYGNNWAFIDNAIFLFEDGSTLEKEIVDPLHEVSNGKVLEIFLIYIDKRLKEEFLKDKSIQLRLSGSHGYFDLELDDYQKEIIRNFINEVD